ncbi:unnamed protein product, partial [Heterosigma akashiwo]
KLDVDGRISSWQRLVKALPRVHTLGDDLDRQFLATFLPNMANLAVVPLVNSVDTFWVGRMGSALALAGQAAANQAFFTLYFLVAFLPTITAPLVAASIGSGDTEQASERVCEAIFLSNVFGLLGTLLLVVFPRVGLGLILAPDAPAMAHAVPYVRLRALSMIPALISATGFAAYRGLLNTVTPLKVSLLTNLLNILLDPLCIFGLPAAAAAAAAGPLRGMGALTAAGGGGLGAAGAALATAVAETVSGLVYVRLLLRRKLIRLSSLFRPPAWANLKPLVRGGLAMLARQTILNVSFVSAARRAQAMDPSGVAAAAYGIVMQIYFVGIVVHLAVQSTAAALVPSALALAGLAAARAVADRTFTWGLLTGVLLGAGQVAALPWLVPLFTPLAEVQAAVRAPALVAAALHVANGPLFAGEGCLLGLQRFRALAAITGLGLAVMLACLASPLGATLHGVLLSIAAFNVTEALVLVYHHVRLGPLRRRG